MGQGKRNANLQYLMQTADASLLNVIDESALSMAASRRGIPRSCITTT